MEIRWVSPMSILYEDLLHATGAAGALTIEVAGLFSDTKYEFTLYAWNPAATDSSDKVWDVTAGVGLPMSNSVNFQDDPTDNEAFGLVYTITTNEGGFQITNTAGLPQSAINGFKLVALGDPVKQGSFGVTSIGYLPDTDEVSLTWNSVGGVSYVVKYSFDLIDWDNSLGDVITAGAGVATSRTFNLPSGGPSDASRLFFRVEESPILT